MKRLLTCIPLLIFCLLWCPVTYADTIIYLDENGQIQEAQDPTEVTSQDQIWTGGFHLVSENVEIASGETAKSIMVRGEVGLILANGAGLSIDGRVVSRISTSALTVYAQSTGAEMGRLQIKGTPGQVAIDGDLTVCGGAVSLTGGEGAVAVKGDLTVCGGAVSLTGGEGAVAVKGGLTVCGGAVSLTGGEGAAAIEGDLTMRGGMVRATGGDGIPDDAAISGNVNGNGIVFTGKAGKVYGNAALPADLVVGEGETLDIPQGATLRTADHTLTVQGGKLTGTVDGTVRYIPVITAQPENAQVQAGDTACFTVAAQGSQLTWQWQQSTDGGRTWQNLTGETGSTLAVENTTLEMDQTQYRCVITDTNDADNCVATQAAVLTVAARPVTGVTLDQNQLNLIVDQTAQLTATVQPEDATDKAVTWASSNAAAATVDANGQVTAKGPRHGHHHGDHPGRQQDRRL